MRRAKVGGYRDYFDERQLVEMDRMTEARLLPGFGYLSSERRPQCHRRCRGHRLAAVAAIAAMC